MMHVHTPWADPEISKGGSLEFFKIGVANREVRNTLWLHGIISNLVIIAQYKFMLVVSS